MEKPPSLTPIFFPSPVYTSICDSLTETVTTGSSSWASRFPPGPPRWKTTLFSNEVRSERFGEQQMLRASKKIPVLEAGPFLVNHAALAQAKQAIKKTLFSVFLTLGFL